MIQFDKMQALGNDFVFIDRATVDFSKDNFLNNECIKFLCNRKYGIGCDTLVTYSTDEIHGKPHVMCDFYNSDGTKAEICGNAMRCLGLLLNKTRGWRSFRASYFTEQKQCELQVDFDDDVISVNMGQPNFEIKMLNINPSAIPNDFLNIGDELQPYLGEKVDAACVSVGNPHVVIFSSVREKEEFGQILNNRKYFRNGVNVSFAKVKNRGTIELQVYERGCGFTLACGSGACATAYLAMKKGLVDTDVIVKQKGGDLQISLQDDGTIVQSGTADYVFHGLIEL